MAAAPAVPPAVEPSEGEVVSLLPPTIASCAHEHMSTCTTPPITWHGSVVAASSLMPPTGIKATGIEAQRQQGIKALGIKAQGNEASRHLLNATTRGID
jgi:hypothetical protein